MKRKVNTSTLLLLVALFQISTIFSQTRVLSSDGKDTLICFTENKAKFLQKKYYQVQELSKLDSVCERQLSYCDSLHKSDEKAIEKQSIILTNQKEIIDLREYEIKGLNTELKQAHKDTRKQKVYKWVAIIIAGAVTSYSGYYKITH